MIWKSLLPSTWNPAELDWSFQDLNSLTDIWVHFTIFISVIGLTWALYRTLLSVRRSNRYLQSLKRFNTLEEFSLGRGAWSENRYLPLARSLDELLVEVPRPFSPLEKDLRRCGSASEVFNSESLAHGLIGNRFLLAMPGILTGLGVLGTFVGLQIGIGSLNLDASQIANLDKSIAPIIKGCSTAFATSVWGVVCSLIVTVAEKAFEWIALRRIRLLQERVNDLVPRYTPESSMIELQRATAESEGVLKGLAIAIGEQMQKAMDRLGNSITEAVKDSLGGQAQNLGKMSADLMSAALTDELGKLQDAVSGMADGFRREFMGASAQLSASVAGFDSLLKKVDESVSTSGVVVKQAVERLAGHEEVVKGLEAGASKLKESAIALTEMRDTFILSATKNSDAASAQESAASANKAVALEFQRMSANLSELQQLIGQGAGVIAAIGQPLKDVNEMLRMTPDMFGRQAEEQSARDERRSGLLLEQTEKLALTVANAAEKFGQVEGLSRNLSDSAASLDRAGTALGVLVSGIENASNQHLSAAHASEKAAQASERTAEIMQPISSNLSCLTDNLAVAGSKVKDGADAAAGVYDRLLEHQREWYKGVELGLSAMRDRLQEILLAYGDSVDSQTKDQMAKWNKAVQDSLSKFSTQVQTLEGAINDLTSDRRK